MSEVRVAVDAMGGDNAPVEIVKGAIDAVNGNKDIFVYLVGVTDIIKDVLKDLTYDESRVEIVDAPEIIATDDPPVLSIRRKKKSSIVVGQTLVKEGKADGFVSSGSTGAVLVGAQLIVGRLKGVDRPPLAPLIPTRKDFLFYLTVVQMLMLDLHIYFSLQSLAVYIWSIAVALRILLLEY